MPTCNCCNKDRTNNAGAIVGMCTLCLSILESEAARRGFELTAEPQPGEPTSRTVLGARLIYWRGRWRVE